MAKIGAEIIVTAKTDYAVKSLKHVEVGSNRVRDAVDAAGKKTFDFGKAFKSMQSAMEGANKRLQMVGNILGGSGLVSTIGALGSALDGAVQRAREFSAVQQGLKVNLDGARRATGSLVADYDLMVAANKATTLGVVKTGEEFAKLAGVAAKLGASVGLDATTAVDDLTTALGRGSVMILDNLGISLKLQDAYDIYSQRLGKTAAALTDAEKKQAFLTVAMEMAEKAAADSGVRFDSAAAKAARVATAWQNLKDGVSTATVEVLAFTMDPMTSTMRSNIATMKEWDEQVQAFNSDADALQSALIAIADRTNGATSTMTNLIAEIGLTSAEMGKFQRVVYEEQLNAKAKERFLLLKGEEEQRRKSMVLAERQRDLAADELALSKIKTDKEDAAAAKRAAQAAKEEARRRAELAAGQNARNFDGGVDDQAVVIDNVQKARERLIQSEQQAIALQERKLELLRIEQSFAGEAGSEAEKAAAKVAANDAVYFGELRLLELQRTAATERGEIFAIETEQRKMALQRQLEMQAKAAAEEKKWQALRVNVMGKAANGVTGAIAQITTATVGAAESEKHAGRKALAGFLENLRNQMITISAAQAALAIVSAASYDYGGAALHVAASVAAASVAVVAGRASSGIMASIPSSTTGMGSMNTGGGGGGGSMGATGGGGGSSNAGPVSRPAEGLPATPRSGTPKAAPSFGGANIYVLGATADQVGTALTKLQKQAGRAEGRFAS